MTTTLKGGEAGRHPSQPSEPAAAAPPRRYKVTLLDFFHYCIAERLALEDIFYDTDGGCHAILRKQNLRSIRVENGTI